MNSTILSFFVVAAVAAFTADAMIFGIPMSGVWRNFRGGPSFGFNFMQAGEQGAGIQGPGMQGFKFVPAMVAPAATAPPPSNSGNNPPVVGTVTGLASGNNFVSPNLFGGVGQNGFAFAF